MKIDWGPVKQRIVFVVNKRVRRIGLFFNELSAPCRMYRQKPQEEQMLCPLCAEKGGWLRCSRSRQLQKPVQQLDLP